MVNLFLLLPFIHQLSWSDFKGPVDYTKIRLGYSAESVTQWELTDSIDNGRIYFNVECVFVPEKSWTITQNAQALSHENCHVWISELYCKRLKKALSKYRGAKESNRGRVLAIYNEYWRKCRTLQACFDKATKHSQNGSVEENWEGIIIRKLAAE